jgi:hypothetical protein
LRRSPANHSRTLTRTNTQPWRNHTGSSHPSPPSTRSVPAFPAPLVQRKQLGHRGPLRLGRRLRLALGFLAPKRRPTAAVCLSKPRRRSAPRRARLARQTREAPPSRVPRGSTDFWQARRPAHPLFSTDAAHFSNSLSPIRLWRSAARASSQHGPHRRLWTRLRPALLPTDGALGRIPHCRSARAAFEPHKASIRSPCSRRTRHARFCRLPACHRTGSTHLAQPLAERTHLCPIP